MNTHAEIPVAKVRPKTNVWRFLVKNNTIVIFVILVIISSFLSDAFFTSKNIYNVLRQQAPILCVGIGMLIVLLSGGIDLSAGSIAAVAGVIMSMALTKWGFTGIPGLLLAFVMSLCIGVLTGLIIGMLISYFKLAPFIITLAFQTVGRGMAYLLTSGQPIRLGKEAVSNKFMIDFGSMGDPVLGIPWPVLLILLLTILFILIMKYTAFGRKVIAIGSNEEAVRLSGIKVNKYKISTYVICSTMAALGGILILARAAVATANAAEGYELDAIAGCVIGGASLAGGKGSVIFTVIGVLTLGLIGNIMNLMSVATYSQRVIKGLIIVAAVLLQTATSKSKA